MFFAYIGLQALRTGDASGMSINDRPVETRSEMRSFVYWGLYVQARGFVTLFVPHDECRPECEDEEEESAPLARVRSPASRAMVRLLRLAFLVMPPRGGCEPDEPWPLLG
jgi:hypothetical protein